MWICHFLQVPWPFVSIVLLGPGGQERPRVRLCNQFGACEHNVEERWRRQRVGKEQAGLDRWVGGGNDGQHSVFPFVCLLQMMKRKVATAARSQDWDVGARSIEAASRPMALRKLSRGTLVWDKQTEGHSQDDREGFEM